MVKVAIGIRSRCEHMLEWRSGQSAMHFDYGVGKKSVLHVLPVETHILNESILEWKSDIPGHQAK